MIPSSLCHVGYLYYIQFKSKVNKKTAKHHVFIDTLLSIISTIVLKLCSIF